MARRHTCAAITGRSLSPTPSETGWRPRRLGPTTSRRAARGSRRTSRASTTSWKGEFLNRELFGNLLEAKILVEGWRQEYNDERPHSSQGDQTRRNMPAAALLNSVRAPPSLRSAARSTHATKPKPKPQNSCFEVSHFWGQVTHAIATGARAITAKAKTNQGSIQTRKRRSGG